LFLFGVALHSRDKIRDEIGASLVIVLDIRPLRLGMLLEARDGVIAAGGHGKAQGHGSQKAKTARHRYSHDDLLTLTCSTDDRVLHPEGRLQEAKRPSHALR